MAKETKRFSAFKEVNQDKAWFEAWVKNLEALNQTAYERIEIITSLGRTIVWGINKASRLPALVVFPGFRTTALFWDMDRALDALRSSYKVYLVETNGQPNLSDGCTPQVKGTGYGKWAAEVLYELGLRKASIAGASFGGLICLKLCAAAPQMVDKVFLLNPGCLQPFSLSLKNFYYNLLPILFPATKSIRTFLAKAVFYKQSHTVSAEAMELMIQYERFALTRYADKTQKPYAMRAEELSAVTNDVYLLLGKEDVLFPAKRSVYNAKQRLKTLKGIYVLPDVGHGIETKREALELIGAISEGEERNPEKTIVRLPKASI